MKWPIVRGNTDRALLDVDTAVKHDSAHMADVVRWCASQLSSVDLEFLRSFQPTIELKLDQENQLVCFHGSPHSGTDIILATTPEAELEKFLSGATAQIMAGGHTHTQLIRRFKNSLILNPGSVGLSHRRMGKPESLHQSPWTEYALMKYEKEQFAIELRRVRLDPAQLEKIALQSAMPHATRWVKGWE